MPESIMDIRKKITDEVIRLVEEKKDIRMYYYKSDYSDEEGCFSEILTILKNYRDYYGIVMERSIESLRKRDEIEEDISDLKLQNKVNEYKEKYPEHFKK